MNVAATSLEGHQAYLQALNRALRIGLVASLAVHAALAGLLPSPFHHDHPLPQTLEVDLVEEPPRPQREESKPSIEPPAALPLKSAASSKPEPVRNHRAVADPKPVREQPVARVTSTVRAPEHLLTHAEPEKAVTAVPVATEGTDTEEKPAATASTVAKDVGAEAGPETPPSFRAGYLRNPEPQYPSASRRLGEQGTVQLRVLVSADGHAAHVDVHRSSGFPRLDEAGAAAVREWRFVPAKRGTTPVEAHVIVPIVFKLEAE
jgi:protein TonB